MVQMGRGEGIASGYHTGVVAHIWEASGATVEKYGRVLKALSTGDFNGDGLIDYAMLTVRLPQTLPPPHPPLSDEITPISRHPVLRIRAGASTFFTPRLVGLRSMADSTLDPFSERTPR